MVSLFNKISTETCKSVFGNYFHFPRVLAVRDYVKIDLVPIALQQNSQEMLIIWLLMCLNVWQLQMAGMYGWLTKTVGEPTLDESELEETVDGEGEDIVNVEETLKKFRSLLSGVLPFYLKNQKLDKKK